MTFNLLHQSENKDSLWIKILFYSASALLVAVIFSYFLFVFKIYLLSGEVDEINEKSAAYSADWQKLPEKKLLDYKKKIDDFVALLSDHKISSNLFSFIEENTLSNVWFSNFDISQSANNFKLSGETENIETLSRQIELFEKNPDYIKNIILFSFQTGETGRIKFTLSLSLGPSIFNYNNTFLPTSFLPDSSSMDK